LDAALIARDKHQAGNLGNANAEPFQSLFIDVMKQAPLGHVQ